MLYPSHATLRTHFRRIRLAAAVALLLSAVAAGWGGPAVQSAGATPLLGAVSVARGTSLVAMVGFVIVGALVTLAVIQVIVQSRTR